MKSEPTANTVSTTRSKTLWWVRGETNELLSIKLAYFVFVPLFSKQILTKQNIASTKNSQEFLAYQVPILRKNKATNSSTSIPSIFRLQWKPLYFVI